MQKADRAKQYAELIRKEHMSNGVIKQKENIYETDGDIAPAFDEKHHFSATMDEKKRKDMLEKRMRVGAAPVVVHTEGVSPKYFSFRLLELETFF